MRILMFLALATYWLTHPAAVQRLVQVAGLAASALAHAHGDHMTAHSVALSATAPVLLLGSHWH